MEKLLLIVVSLEVMVVVDLNLKLMDFMAVHYIILQLVLIVLLVVIA